MAMRQERQFTKAARTEAHRNKRKRGSPEPVLDAEPLEEQETTSDSDTSEHSEQALLDSFQQDIAAPVEAFNEAAAYATAFLQPSEQLSTLARQAAKVIRQSSAKRVA